MACSCGIQAAEGLTGEGLGGQVLVGDLASLSWEEGEKTIMYSSSMKRTVHPSGGRGLSQSL